MKQNKFYYSNIYGSREIYVKCNWLCQCCLNFLVQVECNHVRKIGNVFHLQKQFHNCVCVCVLYLTVRTSLHLQRTVTSPVSGAPTFFIFQFADSEQSSCFFFAIIIIVIIKSQHFSTRGRRFN
jgi:hypothetical protein